MMIASRGSGIAGNLGARRDTRHVYRDVDDESSGGEQRGSEQNHSDPSQLLGRPASHGHDAGSSCSSYRIALALIVVVAPPGTRGFILWRRIPFPLSFSTNQGEAKLRAPLRLHSSRAVNLKQGDQSQQGQHCVEAGREGCILGALEVEEENEKNNMVTQHPEKRRRS